MNSTLNTGWSTPEQTRNALAGNSLLTLLTRRLEDRTAQIGVIGLGPVGLRLATRFTRKGFPTAGFEIDPLQLARLGRDAGAAHNIPVQAMRENDVSCAEFAGLAEMDVVLICDPTPPNADCPPDPFFVTDAAFALAQHLRHGQLIVLECATASRRPDELMISILEESGIHCPVVPYRTDGQTLTSSDTPEPDFFLAYSPDRPNRANRTNRANSSDQEAGNRKLRRADTAKTVGGVNGPSALAAQALYQCVFERTLILSPPRAAQMAAVIENANGGGHFLPRPSPSL